MLRQCGLVTAPLLRPTSTTTIRALSQTVRALASQAESSSGTSESKTHTTEKNNVLDVQSAASKGGRRDRQSDQSDSSSAASERNKGDDTKTIKKDFPEAPRGPVIGMNDERGGVSSS